MIKTFPIRMSEEFHKELKQAAHNTNLSINSFIIKAIETKIKKARK